MRINKISHLVQFQLQIQHLGKLLNLDPQTSPNTAQQSASPSPFNANSSYRFNHLNWLRFGQVAKSGSTNITTHSTTICITLPIQCSPSNRFNHLNWSRSGQVAKSGSTNITKHNTTHCITLPIQCSHSNRFNHLNWSRSGQVALYGQYK